MACTPAEALDAIEKTQSMPGLSLLTVQMISWSVVACMDAFRCGGAKVCPHRPIRLDRLDAAVWADVCQLLQNPKALRDEFERRLSGADQPDFDLNQIQKQIKSVQRGISRLSGQRMANWNEWDNHYWPCLYLVDIRLEWLQSGDNSWAALDRACAEEVLAFALNS
jgi:hypothetical protein